MKVSGVWQKAIWLPHDLLYWQWLLQLGVYGGVSLGY